jgi:hypothetical protein
VQVGHLYDLKSAGVITPIPDRRQDRDRGVLAAADLRLCSLGRKHKPVHFKLAVVALS